MPQPKRPLTTQEKERILYQASQNVDISEIARELNVDVRRVTGYVRTMINAGKLPAPPPKNPSPEISMGTPSPNPQPEGVKPPPYAPPAPPPQASYPPQSSGAVPPPPPQQAGPVPDGWTGGRPVSVNSGGFQNMAQTVRTVVERKIPADGILGEHTGEITREQICEIYGEGLYKILRYEPGKSYPMEYEVKASLAYGPPRIPKRTTNVESQNRPVFGQRWNRPWERSYEREDEDGNRPPPRPYQPVYNRPDPSLSYEYARHNSMSDAAAAATTEAIKQMGQMNDRTIEQLEKARTTGPDNFVSKVFADQQTLWERKFADDERRRVEDEKRRAEERKDEEAKHERRQKEAEAENRRRQEALEAENRRRQDEAAAESRRRQDEAEKAHQRELERIKAEAAARDSAAKEERKMLLDIEEKRLQVMREEHRMRQEALQEELKRNREELKTVQQKTEKEIKETRESVSQQIGESQDKLKEQLEHDRAVLEREHKLKEKSLERENELNQEIFNIKKESLQNQGGDQIMQIINTVVKEFGKGLEKIVDLKKLEAMTPEAQAAAVAKGTIDGNVIGEPKREPQQPEQPKGQQQQPAGSPPGAAQAPKNGNTGGNGLSGAGKGETKPEETQMEQIIQDMLDKPFFKQVIKEWSLHVKTNQDPTTFANMYMEWMRDPLDHEGRKATTMFANFMKPRDWNDMMKILGPKLEKDVVAIFRSEAATDFYDGFKAMVVEQIRDYWEQFLAARKAQRAAQTAAGEPTQPEGEVAQPQPGDGNKQ